MLVDFSPISTKYLPCVCEIKSGRNCGSVRGLTVSNFGSFRYMLVGRVPIVNDKIIQHKSSWFALVRSGKQKFQVRLGLGEAKICGSVVQYEQPIQNDIDNYLWGGPADNI